jgi:colanic acid biosynthesis glycosyl transferase WcaI
VTLIFLNRYFYPDHSATSQMLSDLTFSLSTNGYDVRVITSRQLYDRAEKLLAPREIIGTVNIERVWTTCFGRHNLIGRAVDYMSFCLLGGWALARHAHHGDVIIAMTDPPMLSVILAPIARWRGAHLVNWLQDLFPEIVEALGLGRRQLPAFVYRGLRILRNWSLRAAAMNVAIGNRMAAKLLALGIPANRISIIPNWADASLIHPVTPAINPLRRDWGLESKFVVGYSGNLGRAHDFEILLDAIMRVERSMSDSPQIQWLFVGGGAHYSALASELAARVTKSVLFKPYQPRERLAQSLCAADVHLVHLKPELEGLIVPSKFYAIAAAGRPAIFVGSPNGEIAQIIRRKELGYVVAQGDGAALATQVLTLAHDLHLCRQIGARARRACEDEFKTQISIKRWELLLTGLLSDFASPQENRQLLRKKIRPAPPGELEPLRSLNDLANSPARLGDHAHRPLR